MDIYIYIEFELLISALCVCCFCLMFLDIFFWLCFADLDVQTMLEEAKSRWLRPNEIHAILSNPIYFTINVKPVNLPNSNNTQQ